MGRFATIAILVLVAGCATTSPEPRHDGPTKSWNDGFDTRLEALRAQWDVPGGALAVVDANAALMIQPLGVKRAGSPDAFDADTLFPIASNSKTFTAAAIGVLVDRGKMKWDDKVVDHYPDFALADAERAKAITVRDLLVHRSGLPSHGLDHYVMPLHVAGKVCDKAAMFAWAKAKLRPAFGLREKEAYSNYGYIVLAEVITRVSGEPFATFIKESLLAPLGMSRTVLGNDAFAAASNATSVHELDPEGVVAPTRMPKSGDCRDGASGVVSSVNDLTRFLRMFLNGGVLDGKRVLSTATTAELMRRQMPMKVSPFHRRALQTDWRARTLGWETSGYKGEVIVRMGGFGPGYQSALMLLPERKLGVIVLQNFSPGAFHVCAAHEALDRLIGAKATDWVGLFRRFFPRPPDRRAVAVPAEKLADYTGSYVSKGFPRRVGVDQGKLYLFGNNPVGHGPPLVGKSRLFGLGPDAFFIKTGDGVFTFRRDASGKVVGFDEAFNGTKHSFIKR